MEQVSECGGCQRSFSLFVRKHHCRLCGHTFYRAIVDSLVAQDKYSAVAVVGSDVLFPT